MVRRNRVDDSGLLAVFLREIRSDDRVGPFLFLTQTFAHIMHERATAGQADVQLQLRRHNPADECRFPRVIEIVLAVACAVFQTTKEFDNFRMHAGNTELEEDLLCFLDHQLIDILLDPLHDFLNPGRMDPSIGYEAFQRHLRDFPAQGIESGDHHRFGCLIHHQVHAGHGFERPDIAPFPADNAALHAVIRNRHDGNRGFGDIVPGDPLNRTGDDFFRLAIRSLLGLILNALDHLGRIEFRFLFHLKHNRRLGLIGRHP